MVHLQDCKGQNYALRALNTLPNAKSESQIKWEIDKILADLLPWTSQIKGLKELESTC